METLTNSPVTYPNGHPVTGVGKIYVRPYNSTSKVRAFVDINYAGLNLRGLRIMDSEKGLYITPPAQLDKDTNKWNNHFTFYDKELKTRITHAVLAEYERMGPHPTMPPAVDAPPEHPPDAALESPF